MTAIEFNKQVLGFRSALKYFALNLTMNDEDAKDLLQETLLKAMTYRDKFREKTNLKAWLYTIMKNTFINNYRRNIKSNTIMDNTKDLYFINIPQNSGFASPESTFNTKEINKIIDTLEDEYKVPFTMFVDGFKYKDIAEELELPIGTVKSRIFLARKKLMEQLKGYDRDRKAWERKKLSEYEIEETAHF
jgi:RNA polymerase sigma-70 factor (ECF subfamily)